MDLNARVNVNCGWEDGRMDGNWTPISHLAKAGATKISFGTAIPFIFLFNH